MNKWEERLSDKNDNRQLLIESSEFVSRIKLSKGLKESLSMQAGKAGTLIVKNIPVTILDRENLNGRIYSTETMRQAIEEAREAMADKQTLGQANEHPESSFVAPTDASHVIINAYIKENIAIVVDGKKERHNVLFTDWEVLNTTHGKDLRALFEAECSFGTSIRGVGELSGKMVENYSFISVDGVGNPSSSTYTRMPVSESVKVELKDPNELKENYTVMSSSTNVVRDLSQAGILQQQLNANPYGTITKTSTKVDQETDPKTGAQTSITTVEADTEDEVSDLNQAFAMAHKAMTNGISKVNSVTIEANEDEDEQGNKKESVDSDNGLEAYVPESTKIIETSNEIDDEIDRNQAEFKRQEDLRNVLNNIGNYFLNILNSTPSTLTGEKDYDDLMFDMYNMFHEVRSASTISFPFDDMERAERISKYEKIIKEANELISRYKKLRPESVVTEGQVVAQGQPEGIEFLKTLDEKGRYMFLDRMRTDCEYFLGGGNYNNKFLWANNPEKQIEYMKWLYNSFPDDKKPEWISMEEIEDYERQMVGKGKEDHSRDDIYTAESTMTESKKEEQKDPNEGRQYVLKIKDNDPTIEEGSNDAPEFVAMKGNAIRFTKDPKKALHFTHGMEESGIVHYSNIQKLLADMGYGDQNIEKWYKKDNGEIEPKKEGIAGAILGGAAGGMIGHPFIGAAAGSLAQDALVDSKESSKLTEDGNTKYSAIIEIVNKGGLPETKSLPVSSTDQQAALKEISNQWKQQEASNDVTKINKLTLVDNQTQEKFNYDPNTNQLIPENGANVQQSQPQGNPEDNITFVEPETLEPKEESVNGEIKQNDKTLDMDIDADTHVEKEFDTPAQASVAKAGIESGKLSGDILLSDAVQPGWYVAHDKIGVSGPYETREACMEGLDGYEDQVSVYEVTESDLNEVLFKNPSEPSDDYVEKPLDEDENGKMFKLQSPNEKEGYMEFKQKDNNSFEILWHDNYVPGDDEPTDWVKDIENTKKLYDKLISLGWKGDEFVVDNDFEKKNYELERQQYGYDNFGNLEFDNDGYAKLYDPSSDNQDLLFIMRDDGKVEVHGSFEVYNDPIQGKEYEGTTDVLSYDDANEMWKEYQARNGYTKEPRQHEEESVVESSLVPVRFSNIKWDEKDAAYRMFEDIEKDMQVSHIEPDVNSANILAEYFESYMNDLNNSTVTFDVDPKLINESSDCIKEIIRMYNDSNNRKYPKIETADVNLK